VAAVLRSADLGVCDQYMRLAYVEHNDEHRTSTVLRQDDETLLRVTQGQVRAVASPFIATSGAGECEKSGQSAELLHECSEALRLAALSGTATGHGSWWVSSPSRTRCSAKRRSS
jgi:hypothetical protein